MFTFLVGLIALIFFSLGVSMARSEEMPRDARTFGTILFIGIAVLVTALGLGLV